MSGPTKKHQNVHWGWYWKIKLQHDPKNLCSDAFRIDIFELARNLTLEKQPEQLIRVEVQGISYHVTVVGQHLSRVMKREQGMLRAWRYWFKAPCCGKWFRFIYFLEKLGCRNCLKLAYQSQRLRPSRRFEAMRKKSEQDLINKGGSLDKKPKRMHRTTWEMLRQRVFEYERLFADALYKELLEYYPRLRRTRLNGFCGV